MVVILCSCKKEKHCECRTTVEIVTSTSIKQTYSKSDYRTYKGRKNRGVCNSGVVEQNTYYPIPDSGKVTGRYSDTTFITTVNCSGDGR